MMQKDLRIIFFGTPDFAVASLAALVDAGHRVVCVVTAIDKPAGRGKKLQSSAVKKYASEQGLPILQPPNLKEEAFVNKLQSYEADLQIVVAFRMLPEIVWNMPPLGTYNVHASLLPDYRGAAPINWAIINGETETGVTTFKLKHEIDTGNILLQSKVEIEDADTAGTLHDKLMEAGAQLLLESVKQIESGNTELRPQKSGTGKEAPKIHKPDCEVNLRQSARSVYNFIRGMAPFPGAYIQIQVGGSTVEKWKFFESEITENASKEAGLIRIEENNLLISTNDYWLKIVMMQAPGKKRMKTSDFLRGFIENSSLLKVVE